MQDAILYLLQQAHSHGLHEGSGTVRILFLDFSSVYNSIQSPLLWENLSRSGVDPHLMDRISDYSSDRRQHVGLMDITSDTVTAIVGVYRA